jgi:intracellular septation protein
MSRAPSWLKPVVDFGPLAVFLLAYETQGLLAATAALMLTTAVALVLSWIYTRKLPLVPVVTAVIVGIFGGLTLWLHDDTFIKLKPTIIYGLFAALLLGGLATGRLLLKSVMGEALPLDDLGWRQLSIRFAAFFFAMALANEVVRRVVSTDLWVLWKVPGSIVLTFLFMLAQTPLIQRHKLPEQKPGE